MRLKFVLPLFFLMLLAACGQATPAPAPTTGPAVFKDANGTEFRFEKPVERVVSLAPSVTEILFAVGAGAQVVGRDSFSDYPADAVNVKDVGGGFGALDTESIIAAKPDLVLAAPITPTEQVKALEDLGLKVFVLANPVSISEMYDNLRLVAKITGHEAEADTLIASLDARVKVVVEKIQGAQSRPLVLYELDGTDPNAPWVPGPGTFINTLIDMSGGRNIGASMADAWVQMGLETIIAENPEIIVLGDAVYGGVTPELVAKRGGWDAISAVKNGKVFTFDDNLASRPGPRLVDGLEAMAKLIHPELFK